jgi:hypothetical protein
MPADGKIASQAPSDPSQEGVGFPLGMSREMAASFLWMGRVDLFGKELDDSGKVPRSNLSIWTSAKGISFLLLPALCLPSTPEAISATSCAISVALEGHTRWRTCEIHLRRGQVIEGLVWSLLVIELEIVG